MICLNMIHQRMMWLRNLIRKKINKENAELRWVNVQFSEIMEGVVLSKETMLTANRMWKKYNNI